MIGLTNLKDGCHHLRHPLGRMFLRVRNGRIVWCELEPLPGLGFKLWPATKATAAAVEFAKTGERLREGVRPAG